MFHVKHCGLLSIAQRHKFINYQHLKHFIMKNIVNNAIAVIIENQNNVEFCVKMKNRKRLQTALKNVDFEAFVVIRKNWQKASNNVIAESKGVSMETFLLQSEKELQTRAKGLICSMMTKGKYRFSQNQAKLAIDCMDRNELIKCVNNTHFNTDLLLSAVIRKMQKYNKLTGKPTTKMK